MKSVKLLLIVFVSMLMTLSGWAGGESKSKTPDFDTSHYWTAANTSDAEAQRIYQAKFRNIDEPLVKPYPVTEYYEPETEAAPYRIAAAGGSIATAGNPGAAVKDREPLGKSSKVTKKYEPITTAVPFWGNEVREMGYELPLPFGIGVNVAYMDQGLDLSEVKLGFNDLETEPSGVTFGNSRSRDVAFVARADVWLLPFLNLYVMGGYVNGEADLNIKVPGVTIEDPILGTIAISDPFKIDVDVDIEGVQGGLGATLAGGYEYFFAVIDTNYSWADLDGLADPIEAFSFSPKVGVVIETENLPGAGAVYIGAMYLGYDMTIEGSVPAEILDPALEGETLNFEVDAEPKQPWNFVFGGSWEFNPRWNVVAEAGVGERKQLILGGMFRF